MITENVSAGNADTAGGRQALQMLTSDMTRHITVLQDKANRTTDSIISTVKSSQITQRKRLALQMDIDALRTQLGATTDVTQRATLSQQIRQLESERAALK
ncbi:hypothetical protein ACS106_000334 [Escherichia coli]